MKEIVKSHTVLREQFELVKNVAWVCTQTVMYLIIAAKGFKVFDSSRKFAC